jgi:hypothetical protein
MSAGLLLDVASYYAGLVIPLYRDPENEFVDLPFRGRPGRIVARLMSFYNRRLATIGKRRWATGHYGRRNSGWRELYDGFVPDMRLWKLFRKGLFRWWKCEIINLRLILGSRAKAPVTQASTTASAEACEV